TCFAATVGGPDMSIPEHSLFIKTKAVNDTLDRYEYNMNVKATFDVEIMVNRDLESAEADTPTAELKGQAYMVKIANNFFDTFEPYVQVGSSVFEAEWDQYGRDVRIESSPGFTWGVGFKLKMFESADYGVKLTLDAKYRDADLSIDKAKLRGSVSRASSKEEVFKIEEWQVSILASKRGILPIGVNDYYVVPYAGVTYSSTIVDARFIQGTHGILYSTFDANDENPLGVVLGCDIMPFFLSHYLWNIELRLVNETAFSLGGTIKF
ncbi:MAG: hypothetical protein QGI05_00860, partial [Candidatus Omnitrophota bacterium]|nr:hypothetical protein [Candidatus Omnitrophota bacterium]